ncbi:MAG: SHD1 domain-containing protein, partial [Pirellulales bacterium]
AEEPADDLFGPADDEPAPTEEPAEEPADDLFGPADETPAEEPADDLFGPADGADEGADDLFGPADDEPAEEPAADEPAADDDLFGPTGDADDADDLFGPAAGDSADEAIDNLFSQLDSELIQVVGAEQRVWVDNTGEYEVRGTLAYLLPGHVRLLKDNGRYTTVPLDRLSERDLSVVQQQASQIASQQIAKLAAF